MRGFASCILRSVRASVLPLLSSPPIPSPRSIHPLSPSLPSSLSPHRQGRSFSVRAHTLHLASITWSPQTDTELIERAALVEGASLDC